MFSAFLGQKYIRETAASCDEALAHLAVDPSALVMSAGSFLHDFISCIPEFKDVSDLIRYHYENFDGSGGPLGLAGDQIPLTVRILRFAKHFDLLTNPWDEQQALSHESALKKLQQGSGK